MAGAQYAGQFGPEDLRQQDSTSKLWVLPTSVEIKDLTTGVDVSLYSDHTMATPVPNPVTIGVATGTAGVSTVGNLLAFAATGRYGLYVNGVFVGPISFPPDPADVTSRLANLESGATGGILVND